MQQADFSIDTQEATLRLTGPLTLAAAEALAPRLATLDAMPATIDLSDVTAIDTFGALLVRNLLETHGAQLAGCDADTHQLIDRLAPAGQEIPPPPEAQSRLAGILDEIGAATVQSGRTLVGLVGFFGATMIATGRILRHPRRLRLHAVVRQFELVGVTALAIIGLMSFLIGIVIGQQGAVQLRQFGAEVFTINLIGRATLRELGVLMTAIMVAGRSGSAFAAQIGSMKLAEEVDAMRVIGISPMEALVVPRALAAIGMMPLLAFYSAMVAIAGGGIYCWIGLDIPPVTFVTRMREVVPLTDLWIGLIKAPVFGLIIAIAGCFQGTLVRGNAEEVGLRTTAAVVQGIFLVIVLDAAFAVFFTSIGWI